MKLFRSNNEYYFPMYVLVHVRTRVPCIYTFALHKQIKLSIEHIQLHCVMSIQYTWFEFAITCSYELARAIACNLCLLTIFYWNSRKNPNTLVHASNRKHELCVHSIETISYTYFVWYKFFCKLSCNCVFVHTIF